MKSNEIVYIEFQTNKKLKTQINSKKHKLIETANFYNELSINQFDFSGLIKRENK